MLFRSRTELLVPGLGFLVAATQRNSFVEKRRPPLVFRSGAFIQSGGEVEGAPEAATPPGGVVGPLATPPCGLGHSWPISNSPSGSVSLLVK